MPRVSIGLPVFNGERFLDEALRSLRAQTFADLEIVVADNASTDGTATICERHAAADPRVRYHRNPENVGAARNFNRVFELSSGEYFKWAAHDDVHAPAFVERCVAVLEARPAAVLAHPTSVLIDDSGNRVADWAERLDLRAARPHERFRAHLRRYCCVGTFHAHPIFGVIRASALRTTGLLGKTHFAADVVLLAELALRGEVHEVPEPLFLSRDHPQRSVHGDTRERLEWLDPANRGRRPLKAWYETRGFLGAVRRAPIGSGERARCYLHVARYVGWRMRHLIGRRLRGPVATWIAVEPVLALSRAPLP